MNAMAQYVPLLVCLLVIFNHGLQSEGLKRKFYPDEPPVKTVMLDNGDIIDCVDFYSQPAMKDPRIRRNPRSRAKFSPQGKIAANNKSQELASDKLGLMIDLKSETCPPGTVPFLKATKAGPLNFSAIHDFARSRAKSFSRSRIVKQSDTQDLLRNREYAMARARNGKFAGAGGNLNIWKPEVETSRELSIIQIWFQHTSAGNVMTLEAGWMVNPIIFGDFTTRFFFFTTNDNYGTILYGDNWKDPANNDLEFVRQSNYMLFGAALRSSQPGSSQQAMQIKIEKNDDDDWDLSVNDELIGHWPSDNYDDEFDFATDVAWGGEIINSRSDDGKHTSTQMGSGQFPHEGIGQAAFITHMTLFDEDNDVYDPTDELETYSTNSNCYDVTVWPSDDEHGCYITVGGPGYDEDRCP